MSSEVVALHLQRALLERLTGMVSTPVGDAVPAGVVALEAMRLIIEVVGEVSSDEVHRMRQPCITKLTAHPQPLQSQVSPTCTAVTPAPHILETGHTASGSAKLKLLSCVLAACKHCGHFCSMQQCS